MRMIDGGCVRLIQIKAIYTHISHGYERLSNQMTRQWRTTMHADDKTMALNVGKTVAILFGLMVILIVLANWVV